MKSDDIIRYRIKQANQGLGDAEALAQAGSWNGTVNRLYCACFYSVAALATLVFSISRDFQSVT